MALHDRVADLRTERMKNGGAPVPTAFQGVTKGKVRRVLTQLDLGANADLVDGVFALLDDQTPSWFGRAPAGSTFADGAATAHLACHIGILQRGKSKLDREGRDYWIKPLRDLGGFEPMTLHEGEFIAGHVKAKSPNSCYRLVEDLRAVLLAPEDTWPAMLTRWAAADAVRNRHTFQAQATAAARLLVGDGHGALIQASITQYAARFLEGYEVLYVDDGDGDRITDDDKAQLARAGVTITLDDAMPDVLLWHPETDWLWVIEAVTSDGEVDLHKVAQVQRMAERCGKAGVGFTTTYVTWKEAAARQGAHRNVAVGTYIWIQGDPSRHLHIESYV
jgi:hypothetical protein